MLDHINRMPHMLWIKLWHFIHALISACLRRHLMTILKHLTRRFKMGQSLGSIPSAAIGYVTYDPFTKPIEMSNEIIRYDWWLESEAEVLCVQGSICPGEAAAVAALRRSGRLGRHRPGLRPGGQGGRCLHRGGGHHRVQKVRHSITATYWLKTGFMLPS